MHTRLALIILAAAITVSPAASASPCDGIIQALDNRRNKLIEPEIARQIHKKTKINVHKDEVMQNFKLKDWSIIYVDTQVSDNPYLFYSGDPLTNSYIALWSGAARIDEEEEIKDWIIAEAQGIPDELASCFAWHVTKNRDM